MNKKAQTQRFIVDISDLPPQYPTNRHDPKFWEALGRTIATYGFLEEVLGKAIAVFTGSINCAEDEIDEALNKWASKLERALSDPLGNLIDSYGKAVRENPNATIENLDVVITELRKASTIRNVLCHGSWRAPDDAGKSIPFFINRQKMKFETPVDISFLEQTHRHVIGLAREVIRSVTRMGWQFPGTNGPGQSIQVRK